MQAAYEVALGRLMADLAKMTKIAPEVRVDFTDPDDCQYTFVHPNGSSHGTVLMPLEDVEAATVELAKPFQEDVLEMLWGPAWPPCPAHPHPAEPAPLDGQAVWRCPTTEVVVAQIGRLGP